MTSPEAVRRRWEHDAFLLLQGLPRGTQIGLDGQTNVTDTQFEGYKLVPAGIHCLTWQVVSPHHEGMSASGLRTALFQYTHPRQVLARRYDAASDTWRALSGVRDAGLVVSREHLQTLDPHLASYAADPAWPALTTWLQQGEKTVARVFATDLAEDDAVCDSFTSMTSVRGRHEARPATALVPHTPTKPASALSETASAVLTLHCTPFSLQQSWPGDAQGMERTRWSVDKSWLLQHVLDRAATADGAADRPLHAAFLCEMELAFILFVHVNNAAALEYWASIITLFCRASSRLGAPAPYEPHPCERDAAPLRDMPQLDAHVAFLRLLTAQCHALPPTCWAEDLASLEPRVLEDLAQLRTNTGRALSAWAAAPEATASLPLHEQLLRAWRGLCTVTHTSFHWNLDAVLDEEAELDDDDEAPVIVENW